MRVGLCRDSAPHNPSQRGSLRAETGEHFIPRIFLDFFVTVYRNVNALLEAESITVNCI